MCETQSIYITDKCHTRGTLSALFHSSTKLPAMTTCPCADKRGCTVNYRGQNVAEMAVHSAAIVTAISIYIIVVNNVVSRINDCMRS